ncbi:alcohol dehydrogenase [Campylobacter sp. MIT 12-8780]|uniref:nucleotidyltransferase family protein n=1 Tax=unclassified Campylobacter TaxID=2593542 RepID=UPI00115D1176|nr:MULTISPECIES: nucleotidyltransferase family protein [unclassified Campylobacter]NDJ26739.1 CBS domain-containing protein [Campylobacter sp. MIT 19-121]TQR42434.1 alcohol dehydrogenase [Campylobacter sp. MIT 12-8780]
MDLNALKLKINSSGKEALKVLGKERARIALVMNDEDKLIGVITDADLRKALLEGYDLNSSIENIYTQNPKTITSKTSNDEIFALASRYDIYDFPVLDQKGRVVKILSVAKMLETKKRSNKVVLMLGGLGSRLAPLTNDTPKPLLKVGSKPILQTIVERFAKQGFCNFIFCVNYKSEMIEAYFKNGSEFGVNIEYIHEQKRLGTAGALSLLDKNLFNESFFVMNGDILAELDFNAILKQHKRKEAHASMCVRKFSYQVPYGVVNCDEEQILSIEEKPSFEFLVSAGIYVLEPGILDFLKQNEYLDMPDLFNLLLKEQKKLVSYEIKDYWIDIGRFDEYQRANDEFKS